MAGTATIRVQDSVMQVYLGEPTRSAPGPAIVLQMDSTTVVPPQHNFEADAAGNLIIRRHQ